MVDAKQVLKNLHAVYHTGMPNEPSAHPSFDEKFALLEKDVQALIQDAERWRLIQSYVCPHPWQVGHTVSVPVSGGIVPKADATRDECSSLTKLVDSAIARRKDAGTW